MHTDNDINKLNEYELEELIILAKESLAIRHEKKVNDGINSIREIADLIGAEVKISFPKKKIYKTEILYRDPKNPNNTWTGRGKIPRWLSYYINQGQSIDMFKSHGT